MSNYATENLRTLALVGHGSCGKTTLIEAMLYRAGMIPEMGSIQRGTTMCDNDLLEKEVGHSIRLAVAHIDTAMTDLTPGSHSYSRHPGVSGLPWSGHVCA